MSKRHQAATPTGRRVSINMPRKQAKAIELVAEYHEVPFTDAAEYVTWRGIAAIMGDRT